MSPELRPNREYAASRLRQAAPTAGARAPRRARAVWGLTLIASMILGVSGQLLMKYGMHTGAGQNLPEYRPALAAAWVMAHPLVLLGLTIYCAGTLFWLMTVSRVALSFVYPLTSLSFVLILIASHFFFGEPLSGSRVAGVAAICVGVTLVTRKESSQHAPGFIDSR